MTRPEAETPLIHLSPSSPLRPPDWSWRLAVRLAGGRRPSPRRWVDGWVARALPLARSLLRPLPVGDHRRRAHTPSVVGQAYRLYCRRTSFRRWEVEARLLAGEAFEQVAAKCDCRATTIEAYHSVFFDVQDRLRAIDYIANSVIGPRRRSGLTTCDIDILMKVVAYGGGPLALNRLIGHLKNPPILLQRWEGLGDGALAEWRSQLLVQGAVLALTMPVDAASINKLAGLQEALQALADHGKSDALAAGLLQSAVRADVDLAQVSAGSPEELSGAATVMDDAGAVDEGLAMSAA
jgi:hypothetical protein